jgi:hypothetical protein
VCYSSLEDFGTVCWFPESDFGGRTTAFVITSGGVLENEIAY